MTEVTHGTRVRLLGRKFGKHRNEVWPIYDVNSRNNEPFVSLDGDALTVILDPKRPLFKDYGAELVDEDSFIVMGRWDRKSFGIAPVSRNQHEYVADVKFRQNGNEYVIPLTAEELEAAIVTLQYVQAVQKESGVIE